MPSQEGIKKDAAFWSDLVNNFDIPEPSDVPNAEKSAFRSQIVRAKEILHGGINYANLTPEEFTGIVSTFTPEGQRTVEGMLKQYHIAARETVGSAGADITMHEADLVQRARAIGTYVNTPVYPLSHE